MPNHPLTGARLGQQTDGPLGGLYLAEAVNELSPLTIPSFANASARDAAFTTWAATPGNAMRDGLHCTVAGIDQVYRGGAWHGIGYFPVLKGTAVGPWTTPVGDTSIRNLGRIDIPDYGIPIRAITFAGVELAPSDGGRVDSQVQTASGTYTWDFVRGDNIVYHKHGDIGPIMSGPQTIYLVAYKPPGFDTGTWTSTSVNFYFTAQLIPA